MIKALRNTFGEIAATLRRWQYGSHPQGGTIYRYDGRRDGYRSYRTDGISFTQLASLLKSGDAGDAAAIMAVAQELEEKDSHLQAVFNTRRQSLTGMDWEIKPAIEGRGGRIDAGLAEAAADRCRDVLLDMEAFELLLEDLSDAIGPNLAVSEIVWEGFQPIDFEPIPAERLRIDYSKSKDIEIELSSGQFATVDPGKFIVHIPSYNKGYPFRRTLIRAAAMLVLAKSGSIKDWAAFCEIFGMPIRWTTFPKGATEGDKQEILEALEQMGSDAYGAFREGIEVKLVEAGGGGGRNIQPYEAFAKFCNTSISILVLGQNLTTEMGGPSGSRAAAEVHDQVRADIRDFDIRAEARTVRGQLLAPMCAYMFPGRDVPVPRFTRVIPEVDDRVQEGNVLDIAVNRLGMVVEERHGYDVLGIPEPERSLEDPDKVIHRVLQGAPSQVAPAGNFGSFQLTERQIAALRELADAQTQSPRHPRKARRHGRSQNRRQR